MRFESNSFKGRGSLQYNERIISILSTSIKSSAANSSFKLAFPNQNTEYRSIIH